MNERVISSNELNLQVAEHFQSTGKYLEFAAADGDGPYKIKIVSDNNNISLERGNVVIFQKTVKDETELILYLVGLNRYLVPLKRPCPEELE